MRFKSVTPTFGRVTLRPIKVAREIKTSSGLVLAKSITQERFEEWENDLCQILELPADADAQFEVGQYVLASRDLATKGNTIEDETGESYEVWVAAQQHIYAIVEVVD